MKRFCFYTFIMNADLIIENFDVGLTDYNDNIRSKGLTN